MILLEQIIVQSDKELYVWLWVLRVSVVYKSTIVFMLYQIIRFPNIFYKFWGILQIVQTFIGLGGGLKGPYMIRFIRFIRFPQRFNTFGGILHIFPSLMWWWGGLGYLNLIWFTGSIRIPQCFNQFVGILHCYLLQI